MKVSTTAYRRPGSITGSKPVYQNVMVVDDSSVDRTLTIMVLKANNFAAEVTDFATVSGALQHLEQLGRLGKPFPNLIVLDLNMPVMDGFDFLDSYRQFTKKLRQECKVVVVSATESQEELNRLTKYSIVKKVLKKPFTNEVLARIRLLAA